MHSVAVLIVALHKSHNKALRQHLSMTTDELLAVERKGTGISEHSQHAGG